MKVGCDLVKNYPMEALLNCVNLKIYFKRPYGIYNTTGLTWKDQNQNRKVEVKYIDESCNACYEESLILN